MWNAEFFGVIRVRKMEILQELEALDKLESEGGLEEHLVAHKVILRYDQRD